jgi:hypothetical protein
VASRDMSTRCHDGHSYFSHRFGMVLFPVRRYLGVNWNRSVAWASCYLTPRQASKSL